MNLQPFLSNGATRCGGTYYKYITNNTNRVEKEKVACFLIPSFREGLKEITRVLNSFPHCLCASSFKKLSLFIRNILDATFSRLPLDQFSISAFQKHCKLLKARLILFTPNTWSKKVIRYCSLWGICHTGREALQFTLHWILPPVA